MMLILALLVGLFLPVQALAIPLSYQFSGALADGGSVNGFLNYESSAAPIATNVRGLQPNQVYAPTSWGFTITSPFAGGTFTGQTIEFCTGHCLFGTPEATTLRIGTGSNLLQLAFQDLNFTAPILNGSRLSDNTTSQWIVLATAVQSTAASVPEPRHSGCSP